VSAEFPLPREVQPEQESERKESSANSAKAYQPREQDLRNPPVGPSLAESITLILASRSPRRREILKQARLQHKIRPVDINEKYYFGESPYNYVLRLAISKAREAQRPGDTILAADTTVVVDKIVFGKPEEELEARHMLRKLSGRRHHVMTAICMLHKDEMFTAVETTAVDFLKISNEEIEAYIATGEPFDKAGGYGIQGTGAKFVKRIVGCYYNVVGLPIFKVYDLIRSSLR
jgi:septum formation protein